VRHLRYIEASRDHRATLLLMENDGTPVISYASWAGSFATIEHDGRRFRLNGQDRETTELIYVPEVEPL